MGANGSSLPAWVIGKAAPAVGSTPDVRSILY